MRILKEIDEIVSNVLMGKLGSAHAIRMIGLLLSNFFHDEQHIEVRNRSEKELYAGIVRVEATGNLFIYISDKPDDDAHEAVVGGDYTLVELKRVDI